MGLITVLLNWQASMSWHHTANAQTECAPSSQWRHRNLKQYKLKYIMWQIPSIWANRTWPYLYISPPVSHIITQLIYRPIPTSPCPWQSINWHSLTTEWDIRLLATPLTFLCPTYRRTCKCKSCFLANSHMHLLHLILVFIALFKIYNQRSFRT